MLRLDQAILYNLNTRFSIFLAPLSPHLQNLCRIVADSDVDQLMASQEWRVNDCLVSFQRFIILSVEKAIGLETSVWQGQGTRSFELVGASVLRESLLECIANDFSVDGNVDGGGTGEFIRGTTFHHESCSGQGLIRSIAIFSRALGPLFVTIE